MPFIELYNKHYSKTINFANIAYFFYNFIFRIPVWVTYLTFNRGIPLSQIGILLSVRYITSIVLELPSGIFADLFGRKITVLIGYTLTFITSLLFIWTQSFWGFLILYMLIGMDNAFISGAEEALIYDSLKESKQENDFHKVSLWRGKLVQYGIIIGTFSGGFLYTLNPALPFLFEALAIFVSIVCFTFVEEPRIDSIKYSVSSYFTKLKEGLKDITKNSYVGSFSLFYALVGGISFCFQTYFNQALLVSLGYSTIAISLIFGSMRVVNISFLSSFMKRSKYFHFKNSILFFPILMLIAYLPGFAVTKYLAVGLVLVSMLIATARTIFLNKYLNDEIESKNRATSISIVNLVLSLIFSLVSYSSSLINNIALTFSVYGLVALFIILPLGVGVIRLQRVKG